MKWGAGVACFVIFSAVVCIVTASHQYFMVIDSWLRRWMGVTASIALMVRNDFFVSCRDAFIECSYASAPFMVFVHIALIVWLF